LTQAQSELSEQAASTQHRVSEGLFALADELSGMARNSEQDGVAMPLGGLRRCEVLGLRLADIDLADRKVTITEGKGGHHRIVPVAPGFFYALVAYLNVERPIETDCKSVFVVLKGPRRGQPLSAAGLDEIVSGARSRSGLHRVTCQCFGTPRAHHQTRQPSRLTTITRISRGLLYERDISLLFLDLPGLVSDLAA
jgi:integrase